MLKNDYLELLSELQSSQIGINPSELHGFIAGLICGGCDNQTWKTLLVDMINDGQKLSDKLMSLSQTLFIHIKSKIQGDDFVFDFMLREDDLYRQIDDLIGWVNHFLLGIGLTQPKLAHVKGDTKEAITDLQEIAKLSYDKQEDEDELAFSFEEIKEFVKIAAYLCFYEFNSGKSASQTIH